MFQVDVAHNGLQAVERARQHCYDLVLMDMQMPEMDGLEATRAIRALPGWDRIPIIAMTANAFGEDRSACLAAGMNDHLGKPTAPADLFAMLLTWLGHGDFAGQKRRGAHPDLQAAAGATAPQSDEAVLASIDLPKLLAEIKHDKSFLRRLLKLAASEHREERRAPHRQTAPNAATSAAAASRSRASPQGEPRARIAAKRPPRLRQRRRAALAPSRWNRSIWHNWKRSHARLPACWPRSIPISRSRQPV